MPKTSGQYIYEAFLRWANVHYPEWQSLDRNSFDVLVSAFTGGYIMSVQNSVEQSRIKESMDLMANVSVTKALQ